VAIHNAAPNIVATIKARTPGKTSRRGINGNATIVGNIIADKKINNNKPRISRRNVERIKK
jgi:hypothetical protein